MKKNKYAIGLFTAAMLFSAVTAENVFTDSLHSGDGAFDEHNTDVISVTSAAKEDTADYSDLFEPVVRFIVSSDIHISSEGDTHSQRFSKMISSGYDIAANSENHYKKLDLIAAVGDIADNGYQKQMKWAKDIVDSSVHTDETSVMILMGNHDYYEEPSTALQKFESVFGTDSANVHYTINGLHFIGLSPDSNASNGWDYNAEKVSWLKEQLESAAKDAPDAPIFVFEHVGPVNTVAGTDYRQQDTGVDTISETLGAYPQVINFSGHSHMPVNDECSILQTTYTNLGTGTLNYYGGNTLSYQRIERYNNSDIAQYYVCEVDASNNVRIRMFDITQNKFVGETYIIEAPFDPDTFVYTKERTANAKIEFAPGAEITPVKATANIIAIEFPRVPEESFSARGYHMTAEDSSGKIVSERWLMVDYYNDRFDEKISMSVGGLKEETEYTIKVYGWNTMYESDVTESGTKFSEPLTLKISTSTTAGESYDADILDVLITENEVKDISKNAMTVNKQGEPVIAYDENIGMYAVTFNGGTTNDSYKFSDYVNYTDSLAYGFTVEAYFKINDYQTDIERAPFSSTQSAGFGFETVGEGKVRFLIHNGSYKKITVPMEKEQYYHWVVVYNGETATAYINGVKIESIECDAPLLFPDIAGQVFFIGADTTNSGKPERNCKCSVVIARVYSRVFDDESAISLYDALKAKRDAASDDTNPGTASDKLSKIVSETAMSSVALSSLCFSACFGETFQSNVFYAALANILNSAK